MLCLKHDLLINVMFNYLRDKGCEVYVDVDVPIPVRANVRPIIGSRGEIWFKDSMKNYGRVDLVAICGEEVIGYEVKSSFNDVVNAVSGGQLSSYASSGFFDEMYLVVPSVLCDEYVCKKVVESYGHYLQESGIGLVCVDASSGEPNVVIHAGKLVRGRNIKPYLKVNEAYFKQEVIAYLRRLGYEVYTEVLIPKPVSEVCEGPSSISRVSPTPMRWLNRIDLIADRCKDAVCGYLCSEGRCEVIGVEVKYRGGITNKLIGKLSKYLNSGVLSRLWLVIGGNSGVSSKAVNMVSNVADLLIQEGSSFTLKQLGRTVNPDICALAFHTPSRTKLTIYSFCDLCCQKIEVDLTQTYTGFNYLSVDDQVEIIKEVIHDKMKHAECLEKCKIMFIRRTKSSHVCYVYP